MDDVEVEEIATDIDVIDIIDNSDPVIIYEDGRETKKTGDGFTSVSGSAIGTGNLIGQVFKLIASFREKEYWELNDKEVKSLNTTCPKIIPKIISEHTGIISCILSILSIIMKRIKLEQEDVSKQVSEQVSEQVNEQVSEQTGLTGGRTA